MPADARSMARSYVRRGEVTVLSAITQDQPRPWHVHARVTGNSDAYTVTLADGAWSCTCGRPADCAHTAAVQLVTGWPSLARKADKR